MVNSVCKNEQALQVLVVEDDRTTARVAQLICESLEYKVYLAVNGLDALEVNQQQQIDMIFMDLQMPVMGGFEAAYEIRQLDDPQKSAVPIIAVSGSISAEQEMRCALMGMNACMLKPYSAENIRAMVVSHLPQEEADGSGVAGQEKAAPLRVII